MSAFLKLSVFLGLLLAVRAQFDNIPPCVICKDNWFLVPTSWENMSKYLRGGCNRLSDDIIMPCRDLVDSMNLWDQYSSLYPLIVELHKKACAVYC